MELTERQKQSAEDRAEIKIKLIRNGLLVKCIKGWDAFPSWEKAQEHIAKLIDGLMEKINRS